MRWKTEENVWIGVSLSTILKVPFLEAFCSSRWRPSGEEIPRLSGLDPASVRLVDHLLSSQEDLSQLSVASMPLRLFHAEVGQTARDLDFLNVPHKSHDLDMLDVQKLSTDIRTCVGCRREAAESLVVALALGMVGFHQLGHVFESVVFVISKPRLFNKNLRENMTTVAALASFTKKQKEILQK